LAQVLAEGQASGLAVRQRQRRPLVPVPALLAVPMPARALAVRFAGQQLALVFVIVWELLSLPLVRTATWHPRLPLSQPKWLW